MPQNYFQHCTAGTDLQKGAKKIYRGQQYQNPKTEDVYEFMNFMPYCIDGQVQVRNLTKNKLELLTENQWFSLLSVGKPAKAVKNMASGKFVNLASDHEMKQTLQDERGKKKLHSVKHKKFKSITFYPVAFMGDL